MDYTLLSVAWIVLLPFCAFVLNSFIVKRFTSTAVFISCAAIFGSFILACRIFWDFYSTYASDYHIHKTFEWFNLNGGGQEFAVRMGVYIDNMTAIMLLMVTAVAFLIHLFSTYYMKDDARYGRFMVYVSLFTSAMLGLVLSENLLSVFIFWELMGFCSYSLIGFYYEKEEAGNASMKAFMTTRVGDVFFLLGIVAIWLSIGSVSFVDIYAALGDGKMLDTVNLFGGLLMPTVATLAAFCIFMGTIGKSAQFPLQVWLPDAMMGPTPCSALIHAATMVAAGVYLSLRIYPLLDAGGLLYLVACIGGITAFGAATIALVQTDFKAVLAYSTISQLGYMVLGVGVSSYNPAFMHLITHAIFKACLFLSAGSVIHSLHDHHTHQHVQEMPRMGGLRHKMPYTFLAMLLCTFAITGMPFFSGFVSKDRILGDAALMAIDGGWRWWIPAALGYGGAFLTAFYMFRMMFLAFFGEPRDKDLYDHIEPEKLSFKRNVPLLLLAIFTLGFWFSYSPTGQGTAHMFGDKKHEWFQTLVQKPKTETFNSYERQKWPMDGTKSSFVVTPSSYDPNHGMTKDEYAHVHHVHLYGAIASVFIFLGGLFMAYMMYIRKAWNPGWWAGTFSGWYRALQNKYYFDDFYIGVLIKKLLLGTNNLLAFIDMGIYDRYIIDGTAWVNRMAYNISNKFDDIVVDRFFVDGLGGKSVKLGNVALKYLQNGKVQLYFILLTFVLTIYICLLKYI